MEHLQLRLDRRGEPFDPNSAQIIFSSAHAKAVNTSTDSSDSRSGPVPREHHMFEGTCEKVLGTTERTKLALVSNV